MDNDSDDLDSGAHVVRHELEHVFCDLCGADDATRLYTVTDRNYGYSGMFGINRCRQCDLVYLCPRPMAVNIGSYYPGANYSCFNKEEPEEPLDSWHPTMRLAHAFGINVRSLLDIGCGSGHFLHRAQLAGLEVAGIEISDFARQQSNTRLGKELVYSSLEDAHFSSSSFDVVTMWHVLEHVPSPTDTLKAAHDLLRPGGILAVAVPNFDSLERRIWGKRWIAVDAPRHFYHFSQSTLESLLSKTGFELISVDQSDGAISLAANILRSVRDGSRFLGRVSPQNQITVLELSEVVDDSESQGSATTMNEARKDRIRFTTTKLVRPLAQIIARGGLGPELMVHARRRGTEGGANG